MPEIWERVESSCICHESNNQAMAIQRMGNWFDWSDISTVQQESEVYLGGHRLFHQMGLSDSFQKRDVKGDDRIR